MHRQTGLDEKPRIRPAADLSKLCQLLDDYPLSRSRSACEASQLIGRALSPHQLHVRDGAVHFEARHNQIHLGQLALNVLSYGSEVEIDPGERGDSYLLQLPLQGRARVRCNGQEAWVGPDTMSVLQPRAETRMIWGGDCAMIMLQVPSQMLRTDGDTGGPLPALNLTRSRHDPAVAAWWQAVIDMTRNLHNHGAQWLRHPAAFGAMEAFLLSGLDLLSRGVGPVGCACGSVFLFDSGVDSLDVHQHRFGADTFVRPWLAGLGDVFATPVFKVAADAGLQNLAN